MKTHLIKLASIVALSISTSVFAGGDHGSHSSKPTDPKSMEGMQRLNKTPDTASNAQIMFLVLNTSGLTAIPISIMVYRALVSGRN